jgi:DNA (cytosine-5)-methyltransferase 1
MTPVAGNVTAPAASRLVLSLFPGVGLLDRGFEAAGFCVVRGPDTLLGQDIRNFHATAGHIFGVIGGPPCQDFSRARRRPPTGYGLAMLQEFARVVTEAGPDWYLMENVPGVPTLAVPGYTVQRFNLYAVEFGSTQMRNRAFQFGYKSGNPLCIVRGTQSHPGRRAKTVLARDSRRNWTRLLKLQGLPAGFDLPGLSRTAKIRAVGNGVPLCMAEAVAVAIRDRGVTSRSVTLCSCGCGRPLTGKQLRATPACRKRIERSRRGDTPGTLRQELVKYAG